MLPELSIVRHVSQETRHGQIFAPIMPSLQEKTPHPEDAAFEGGTTVIIVIRVW
jgi:hypothetical protein